MIQIISFNTGSKIHSYVWCGNLKLPKTIDLSNSAISLPGKTAEFFIEKGLFYKFITYKQPNNLKKIVANNLDKILFSTPASKEDRGNKLLKKIGLSVPKSYGVGFPVSPASPYRCLYIQQCIDDGLMLNEYLKQDLSTETKRQTLDNIFKDISTMHEHHIEYRYMAPKDILVDSKNNIYWIDTRAKRISSDNLFRKQFKRHLFNLLKQLPENSIHKEQVAQFQKYIDYNHKDIKRIIIDGYTELISS